MLELRHLRVLREIASAGSYSAAARALGYTQPAVSQQVRALERAVGTKLTVRAGRRIELTEAGRALALRATEVLGAVQAAEDEAAAIAGLTRGRVRLSAFPSGSATLVPMAIAAATAVHRGMRVSLAEAEPPESLMQLRAGKCDIALAFAYQGSDPEDDADLYRLPLLDDPLLLVLPPEHRLCGASRIMLKELADEAWIAGCTRCRQNLVRMCHEVGFDAEIRFATDDNVAAQSLVAEGLGVALMPRLVLAAVRHPAVTVRPVEPSGTRQILALTWPDMRRVPAVAAVLDALTAAAHEAQTRAV